MIDRNAMIQINVCDRNMCMHWNNMWEYFFWIWQMWLIQQERSPDSPSPKMGVFVIVVFACVLVFLQVQWSIKAPMEAQTIRNWFAFVWRTENWAMFTWRNGVKVCVCLKCSIQKDRSYPLIGSTYKPNRCNSNDTGLLHIDYSLTISARKTFYSNCLEYCHNSL
jgi:hypothetical protein